MSSPSSSCLGGWGHPGLHKTLPQKEEEGEIKRDKGGGGEGPEFVEKIFHKTDKAINSRTLVYVKALL